jgi:hypothetical protein
MQVMKRALGITQGPGPLGVEAAAFSQQQQQQQQQQQPAAKPSLALRLPAAAASGGLMWLVLAPIDVLRSQYLRAVADGAGGPPSTVRGTAAALYSSQGLRGFYRGLSVTLVRAVPVACTVLPLNDVLHEVLAGLATV